MNKRLTEIKQLREQFKQEVQTTLKAELMTLFDQHPLLESIQWRQYTPYFNDGDACVFGAATDYPAIVFGGVEYEEVYDHQDMSSAMRALWLDYQALMGTVEPQDLQDAFGDGFTVTITRDGIETKEYYHD